MHENKAQQNHIVTTENADNINVHHQLHDYIVMHSKSQLITYKWEMTKNVSAQFNKTMARGTHGLS